MSAQSNSGYMEVVRTTQYGSVKGRTNMSVYGDLYYSFEKIPYAEKPLGPLRFRAPQPAGSWAGVMDCTEPPMKPLQKNIYTGEIQGSEDCLYLNIYVPSLETQDKLPVMVYLFGGGFERGDPTRALHGPDYFMMRDVVLVTVGYRVGPLGFLSLSDPECQVPGNAGLKDQLLALQWIKENIDRFNGNNENITLFGSSAGAASTHYMMLTPLAKGLFQKAILMSGDALCPWAMSSVENLPYRLAQANEYNGSPSDMEVLKFLQKLQGDELVRHSLLTKEEYLNDSVFAFAPVIEPYASERSILLKHPRELLSTAWGNEIPIMLGGTSFEGLLMYKRVQQLPFLLEEIQTSPEHLLPVELKLLFINNKEKRQELAKQLLLTHFGLERKQDSVLKYCDYASFKLFWFPKLCFIKSRLQSSLCPTYLYRFDFDSPDFNHQRIKYCGQEVRGVAHVDDNSYLFYGDFSWKVRPDSAEYKTIERMTTIWSNFARYSNPQCQHTDHCSWLPLTDREHIFCLNIGDELEIKKLPEITKLEVWEALYSHLEVERAKLMVPLEEDLEETEVQHATTG